MRALNEETRQVEIENIQRFPIIGARSAMCSTDDTKEPVIAVVGVGGFEAPTCIDQCPKYPFTHWHFKEFRFSIILAVDSMPDCGYKLGSSGR